MTSPVNLPSGIPSYEASTAAAGVPSARNSMDTTAAGTQDMFMKLLMAQIRSQDPLNPQDPAQMTAQLSQLNMASGIQTLNGRIAAMLDQVAGQSFVDQAALIGRQVLASGDSVALGDAGSADFGLTLQQDAAQAVLQVRGSDGTLVDEIALGPLKRGSHSFAWDGLAVDGSRAAAGRYTLALAAADAGGNPVGHGLLSYGTVAAVQKPAAGQSGTANLLLADGRSVASGDIVQLKP